MDIKAVLVKLCRKWPGPVFVETRCVSKQAVSEAATICLRPLQVDIILLVFILYYIDSIYSSDGTSSGMLAI